tara:strand:+ start:255 stop:548 length:294 start_codon:yes stop_codon:yes gene_type:complete
MSNKDSKKDSKNINLNDKCQEISPLIDRQEQLKQGSDHKTYPKWINNKGEEVKQVFGFNENAELVNSRLAMIGFLMLIITELAFAGEPATQTIFGIN